MNFEIPQTPQSPQSGPIPQTLINENMEQDINNQKSKIRLLERLLSVNVLINFIFCLIVIVLMVFLVTSQKSSLQKKADVVPNSGNIREISIQSVEAQTDEPNSVFINQFGLDPDKAFATKYPPVYITKKGSLSKEVFGYLPYWSLKRAKDINIDILTTVSYFGLEIDSGGNVIKKDVAGNELAAWNGLGSKEFKDFTIRAHNNKTKVQLTFKCFSRVNMEKLAVSPDAQNNFINSALTLMEAHNLDGINLDFEYIGTPSPQVRDAFSSIVIRLNKQMKEKYPKAKLSIATFVDAATNNRIHDISVLAQHADSIVIMGYDFRTPGSSAAGPIAPMGGYALNLKSLMNDYLDKAPADKLILTVPYYGYDWPVDQNSENGKVTSRANVKVLAYAEIMDSSKHSKINWDEESQTPWYSYNDGQIRVVHFENTRSLGIKFDFVNQKNMQGIGIWALGFDGSRPDLLQLLANKFAN